MCLSGNATMVIFRNLRPEALRPKKPQKLLSRPVQSTSITAAFTDTASPGREMVQLFALALTVLMLLTIAQFESLQVNAWLVLSNICLFESLSAVCYFPSRSGFRKKQSNYQDFNVRLLIQAARGIALPE